MITIHGSTVSPFVRKTVVIAVEKGIEFTLKAGEFGNPSAEFLACSPFRKIPAMEDGDFRLCDSSAIIHYLEAKQPEPSMIPSSPQSRGRTIWYDELGDTIISAAGGAIFFNRFVAPKVLGREGDLAAAEKAEAEALPPIYDYLEKTVPGEGFLVDDRFTLADAAVASPFVNLAHLEIRPHAEKYPRLTAYLAAIHARPSFARFITREGKLFGKVAA